MPSLYKIAENAHVLETQLSALADAKVVTAAYEHGVPEEVPPGAIKGGVAALIFLVLCCCLRCCCGGKRRRKR